MIRVNDNELVDPMGLVGTLAHELAHQRLLGEGRITSDAFDNELLTDLTVVFKGLGIFLANCPRNWEGQDTRWPDTDLRKPEYMTPPMFGYALALLAWRARQGKSRLAEAPEVRGPRRVPPGAAVPAEDGRLQAAADLPTPVSGLRVQPLQQVATPTGNCALRARFPLV